MDPAGQCMLCDQPDHVDDLVQCDKCDGCVHFSCAGVGDSIADPDRSYTCKRCVELEEVVTVSSRRTSKSSRSTSRSSISAKRLALKMQQLELERRSRLKELDDAEKFLRLRRRVEEDFGKQRLEVLDEQLREEEDRSIRSRVSSSVVQANTEKWIDAVSQDEESIATKSAVMAGNPIPAGTTTRSRTSSLRGSQSGSRAGSRGNTPANNVVAEEVCSTQSRPVVQQVEFVTEPVGIQMPVRAASGGAILQPKAAVPVSSGSQLESSIPAANDYANRPAVSSSLVPGVRYTVTCMGKTTVHYGNPSNSGQCAIDQVRNSDSNVKVGLQPVVEAANTSTPKQLVVPSKNDTNRNSQVGTINSTRNHIESAHLNASQGQFSRPPNPKAKPQESQPPPGPLAPIPVLPPGNTRHNIAKPSVLLPPPGHKQAIGSNPSFRLPPSGHQKVIEPNSSVFLPLPGHKECVKPNPLPSQLPLRKTQSDIPNRPSLVQQSSLDNRDQCDQTAIQPSGYDSFMRKPTLPPARSSDLPPESSYGQPLPVEQRHCGEVDVSSVVPQSGNRHPEVSQLPLGRQQMFAPSSSTFLPPSGYPHYQIATSSSSVPPSGYQQFPVSTSSVLMPSSGHQQYRTSNAMAPEPPPGPEQQFLSGTQNLQPAPVLQNVSSPIRPRLQGPTAEQLAARQVITRELPVFSGEPLDWPLFFSSFRNSTNACGYNDAENLARLQRCLRGQALDSVRSRLLIPESVPHVMATLERLYGRPEVIILALLRRMREIPSPKGDDLKTLIKFGMGVESLVDHMILADQQQHICNPMLLQELVDRLPPNLKLQWASYKRSFYTVNLANFNEFMKDLVAMASDVTLHMDPGSQTLSKGEKASKRENPAKEKLFVHQQAPAVPVSTESKTSPKEVASPVSKPCWHCDKSDHRIAECADFKKLSMDERWKVMRQKGLCRLCLIPHRTWPCRSKQECGIGECHMRHHPLLHSKKPEANSTSPSTSTNRNVAHQHHHTLTSSALLRYLPVTLYGNGKSVEVYAFLDDGSSSTMLEGEVADLLGVKGPSEPLCLCWTGDVKRMELKSQRVEITIAGRSENRCFPLRARTVEQLKLPKQTVVYDELCEVHPHLKKLPLGSYTDVTPQLIIGVDNARLISALKSRESNTGELVAAKTRLGWCIYGRSTTERSPVEYVNAHVEQREESDIHDLFRQFMAVDEASIKLSPQSEEDKRALKILQDTTRRVEGRLETGLLWRYDEPCLPDSYPMAMRRMEALEKKLSKDPELEVKVRGQVAEYLEKGYAHRITAEEWESTEPGRVWYLPLGVVQNPNKPGKVRLIWDAAARVDGISFNDMMLKGPDLLTALNTVLLRFRQKRIAFSGDIKEMFHQFLIKRRDRQAQRFVFRERRGQPPQIFVMDVATFGAACSPCIAQYLKNMNAEEHAEQFPDAARAIVENHYVDDYLDSTETVDEAVKLINEVKLVHAKAGLEIRNFSSNSAEVLERIGETNKVEQKSLTSTASVERVLGMVWKPSEDVFSFEACLKEEVRNIVRSQGAPTKRQVLRTIMSLYDPLGLVAHFSIHGKVLMQRIWRAGMGWDEMISGDILEDWRQWIGLLLQIGQVSVPRCFFSGTETTPNDSEIHVFVDASENAYACVAYLRSVNDGIPVCTLIAAKTKVAPLKPLSIPRLELQAALIGSRLLDTICKALTIPVAARYLWSDSTTVLAWLKSETRRYHQFVGFRVGEILSTTTIDEWRKVQSKVNVADQATKWRDGPSFKPGDWWYTGPAFLLDPNESWRKENAEEYSTEEDMRAVFLHHRVEPPPIIDIARFSKWTRLQRTTAYVIRAVKRFLGFRVEGPLSQDELQKAETILWKQVQEEVYPDEIATLRHNTDHPDVEPKPINKSSALYKLNPMLDGDGVLRMNSRITAAPLVSRDARLPILLPKSHRVTELLVESFHDRFRHGNNETVVNELRQRFYIPHLRVVVGKVARQCQRCRIRKAVPQAPIMAPLPEIRLTAFVRPFTYTGVDYFGPILVKQGRSLVKRWIALFTCLSIRAVHLEVVHSLSTQSCVMAIRRFIACRGAPTTIYSDNGTNFVGASRLLKEQLRVINEECAVTFTNANPKWLFNPPLAPHMGGPWERMVRSVKVAMEAIAEHPHHPSDEVLETVALEAESVVNSRPLTYIPLDHAEQEALTPNHFLLYGTHGIIQPNRDPVEYATLRDSWKLAQYLVDTFWQRWVREYLPTLTRRTKWFQPVRPLKPGDLVVIVNEGKRNGWLRGKVQEVVTGKDGQVRRAVVRTSEGMVIRPATKLALLDVRGDGEEEKDDGSGVPELHGRGDVDEPTVQASRMIAHMVTDQALLMFEDADLIDIGIIAKGPRKIIFASIENLRATQPSPVEIKKTPEENLRAILIGDCKFRTVVYDELDRNKVPSEENLHLMVRILCCQYEQMMYDKKCYPSATQQWMLAKQIIRAFPQLRSTRSNENAPAESAFFWWHNGNTAGEHGGYIYHRVRNIEKGLPKEMKKYNRPDITNRPRDSIPTSVVKRAADLAELIPNSTNIAEIKHEMEECFHLHQLLLREKKCVKEMLLTLPHLISYNGAMIHEAFYRLFPRVLPQLEISSVLGRGLLLSPGVFKEVEDVHVKGALRIYAQLRRKGMKNTSSSDAGPSFSTLAEEMLVAPFVQWTRDLKHHIEVLHDEPHIVCEADLFKTGPYNIVFNEVVLVTSDSFIDTVDLFWKSFHVFGQKVPIKLQMFNDVFSILIYKTLTNSSRKRVNDICSNVKEAIQAEEI